jgi:putative acetyltransferase
MTAGPCELPGLLIRDERPGDVDVIASVLTAAFDGHPHSQGREAAILAALRRRHALVSGLVAEENGRVAGHVAFSAALIEGSGGGWFALGPLATRPDRQRRGIGSALVRQGLRGLRELGAKGCVLLGDPGFYGRFGFRSWPGLTHDAAATANVLALPFGADEPEGEITFHSAFYE